MLFNFSFTVAIDSPVTSDNTNNLSWAPPKYCIYSVNEVILKGLLSNGCVPFDAFSVYPINEGTAVATVTIEFENSFCSII